MRVTTGNNLDWRSAASICAQQGCSVGIILNLVQNNRVMPGAGVGQVCIRLQAETGIWQRPRQPVGCIRRDQHHTVGVVGKNLPIIRVQLRIIGESLGERTVVAGDGKPIVTTASPDTNVSLG